MNKAKSVPFEVVEVWHNSSAYTPFTLKPLGKKSIRKFAVKVENEFFLLGGVEESLHICDLEEE